MPQALRAPLQPLNNAEYRDSLSAGEVVYPSWWARHGGRLVPLESGTGTRITLTAFYPMSLGIIARCDYEKEPRNLDFDPTAYFWRLWIYGGYHKATARYCSEAQSFMDFAFYAPSKDADPLPQITFGEVVAVEDAIEVTKETVTVYFKREIVQEMNVGMFYLGVIIASKNSGDTGIFLPPGLTPAENLKSLIQLPPLWLFVQDASRNYHGRFEDIPKGRGTLCP